MESLYRGVPLAELRIESVEWTEERAQHIRTRSARKETIELDIEPEWATEAVFDEGRIVAITSGDSIKVIGYSSSARHPSEGLALPEGFDGGRPVGRVGVRSQHDR